MRLFRILAALGLLLSLGAPLSARADSYSVRYSVPTPVAANSELSVPFQALKNGDPFAYGALTLGLSGQAQWTASSWATSYSSGEKTITGATAADGTAYGQVQFLSGSVNLCATLDGLSPTCVNGIQVISGLNIKPTFANSDVEVGQPLAVNLQVVNSSGAATAVTASHISQVTPADCVLTLSSVTNAQGQVRGTVVCSDAARLEICSRIGPTGEVLCDTATAVVRAVESDGGQATLGDDAGVDAGTSGDPSSDGGSSTASGPTMKLSWSHAADAGVRPGAEVRIHLDVANAPDDGVLTLGQEGLQTLSLCPLDGGSCLSASDAGYLLPVDATGAARLSLSGYAVGQAGGAARVQASLRAGGAVTEDSVEVPIEPLAVNLGCTSVGGDALWAGLPALAWLLLRAGSRRASSPD